MGWCETKVLPSTAAWRWGMQTSFERSEIDDDNAALPSTHALLVM